MVESEPKRKKSKVAEEAAESEKIEARLIHVKHKIVAEINSLLAFTEAKAEVKLHDVRVTFCASKNLLDVSVLCVLCKKQIKLITTKYTATIANFKGHFSRVHLEKDEKQEPGAKLRVKGTNQPLLSKFYKPLDPLQQEVQEAEASSEGGTKSSDENEPTEEGKI